MFRVMYIFQDFKDKSFLRVIWGVFIIGNTNQAVFLYRLSSWCYTHKLRLLATFFWSLNIKLNSCDISPNAKIGSGLSIYHSLGIVIGEVSIGKNMKLFQNVTIGSVPGLEVGDDVDLFSGCCILASVGDNVTVGANSVVLSDVPSNVTVAGSPARIINHKKSKEAIV
jgi:serine O-acetyltransferase